MATRLRIVDPLLEFLRHHRLVEIIGAGGFKLVFKALDANRKHVAFSITTNNIEHANEVHIYKAIQEGLITPKQSPHFIGYIDSFTSSVDLRQLLSRGGLWDTLVTTAPSHVDVEGTYKRIVQSADDTGFKLGYLITEYASGGDVTSAIENELFNRNDTEMLARVAFQLCFALTGLETLNIIHMDFTSNNVALKKPPVSDADVYYQLNGTHAFKMRYGKQPARHDAWMLAVFDYGLSQVQQKGNEDEQFRTRQAFSASPEMFFSVPSTAKKPRANHVSVITHKTDVFSAGLTLLDVFAGVLHSSEKLVTFVAPELTRGSKLGMPVSFERKWRQYCVSERDSLACHTLSVELNPDDAQHLWGLIVLLGYRSLVAWPKFQQSRFGQELTQVIGNNTDDKKLGLNNYDWNILENGYLERLITRKTQAIGASRHAGGIIELFRAMLAWDPAKRKSASELLMELRYFNSFRMPVSDVGQPAWKMRVTPVASAVTRQLHATQLLSHYRERSGAFLPSDTPMCHACLRQRSPSVALSRCAKCAQALYCNRRCQQRHWPQHKLQCTPC